MLLEISQADTVTIIQALCHEGHLDVMARVMQSVFALQTPEQVWGKPQGSVKNADARIRRVSMEAKLIQTIKEIRAITGMGLKEAKDVVDKATFGGDWVYLPLPVSFERDLLFDAYGFEFEVKA